MLQLKMFCWVATKPHLKILIQTVKYFTKYHTPEITFLCINLNLCQHENIEINANVIYETEEWNPPPPNQSLFHYQHKNATKKS